jgi:S-(hydroxymethyl)glutathione dehydrogenase / alcohol dehydrogenase
MKTPAAILVEQKKDLVIDEVELPVLSFGQVLVQVKVSRICGSQIGEIDGVKGPDKFLPHLLGHEGGGVVVEVGPEVTRVKPGDHVVLHWREARGIQSRAPKYDWNGKTVSAGYVTTFNDFAVVSENRLTPIPPDVDFETAALMADTITTGFGVVNNDAKVRLGESVVVIGAGGIGMGAILGARLAGACPVIAVDIIPHKLERAKKIGATDTVNSQEVDFVEAVRGILHQSHADVVVDGTGQPAILEKAFHLAGPRGRCVGFGVMPHDRKLSINTLPLHMGKILTGSHGGASQPDDDIPRYLRMIKRGLLNLDSFVSHRLPLSGVNGAIEKMRAGEVLHAMIHFDA